MRIRVVALNWFPVIQTFFFNVGPPLRESSFHGHLANAFICSLDLRTLNCVVDSNISLILIKLPKKIKTLSYRAILYGKINYNNAKYYGTNMVPKVKAPFYSNENPVIYDHSVYISKTFSLAIYISIPRPLRTIWTIFWNFL